MMNIEHVNITVSDNQQTAAVLGRIFDWYIRWEGDSLLGGHTVHCGTDDTYVALYTPPGGANEKADADRVNALQHIGVVVDDLDQIEARVEAEGLTPYSHMTYDPGSRFYFNDGGIEYEVVSYTWPGRYN